MWESHNPNCQENASWAPSNFYAPLVWFNCFHGWNKVAAPTQSPPHSFKSGYASEYRYYSRGTLFTPSPLYLAQILILYVEHILSNAVLILMPLSDYNGVSILWASYYHTCVCVSPLCSQLISFILIVEWELCHCTVMSMEHIVSGFISMPFKERYIKSYI